MPFVAHDPAVPYDADVAEAIIDAIATSSLGLGSVIKELGLTVRPSTFYRWLQKSDELRERYARARADQAQVMAEEIAQIADNTERGEIITLKADGTQEIKSADMIEHRKLRIESRKWLAAKLIPKVYGDKMAVTGADGGAIQIVSTIPRPPKEGE